MPEISRFVITIWTLSMSSAPIASPSGAWPTARNQRSHPRKTPPDPAGERAHRYERPCARGPRSSRQAVAGGRVTRDDLIICDIVALEYLMGARTADDYARLERVLSGFRSEDTVPADWARARSVHRSLARLGAGHQRSVRIPDLLITAVAERSGLAVAHYDEDYDRIATITGQPTRWVMPAAAYDPDAAEVHRIRTPRSAKPIDAATTYRYTGNMKATIDIPESLYRQVKARSALGGRSIRDVTIELYRRWLADPPAPDLGGDAETPADASETWLASWEALGAEVGRAAVEGPTTREILVADRR